MQKKYWGAIKKNQITSSQPRKLIFGIQPYLTQLDEIHTNNTDWGAKKIEKNWGAIKKIGCHQKKSKSNQK